MLLRTSSVLQANVWNALSHKFDQEVLLLFYPKIFEIQIFCEFLDIRLSTFLIHVHLRVAVFFVVLEPQPRWNFQKLI